MGDSFQFAATVDGNANNVLNWNDLTTSLPALRLPLNSLGDSVDSVTGEMASGTVNAPITSMANIIDNGVICNFDVTNDLGSFNGICNGFLTDASFSSSVGAVLNAGGSLIGTSYDSVTCNGGVTNSVFFGGNGIELTGVMNCNLTTGGAGLIFQLTCNGGVGCSYDFSGIAGQLLGPTLVKTGILIMPDPAMGGSPTPWDTTDWVSNDRFQMGTSGKIYYASTSPALPNGSNILNQGVFAGSATKSLSQGVFQ